MKNLISCFCVFAFVVGCDNHHHNCENHDHAHEHKEAEHGHKHDGHGHEGECGLAHEEGERPHSAKKSEIKTLRISKSIQDVMGLKTVHAEKRRISSVIASHGRYEIIPDARETVASSVAGRLEIFVKPLSYVKKGDILFKVTSPDLVARAREIQVLEKRLSVYREIKTRNAALENELAVKKAERAAMIGTAEEKDGVVVAKSTTDGLVEELHAKNGDWVEIGAKIFQLANPKALRLKVLLPPSDAARLKDGFKAHVEGGEGSVRLGIGDDSGLVPVYVVFDKGVNAIAGARDDVTFEIDSSEEAKLAVPSKCIVDIRLQPTVFVRDINDHELFIAVPVVPLQSSGGWTSIASKEILPKVEIVSDGVYELRLALPDGEKKTSGHFHADGTFHDGEH
jgi:biotin carboxyl carrier protein